MASMEKVVSGGQTGVDRAALAVAMRRGIAHGGWCPRNRRAEDGSVPERFLLQKTRLEDYAQRTEWNVRDSDATVIFTLSGELCGGTLLTANLASDGWGRPCLHIALGDVSDSSGTVRSSSRNQEDYRSFIAEHEVRILNVAGPRESEEPGIGAAVESFLLEALIERGER